MTYRSIDLQVSVPRVHEQSATQQQAIHRSHAEQTRFETDAVKQTEVQRTQNTAIESGNQANVDEHRLKEDRGLKNKRKRSRQSQAGADEEKNAEIAANESKHPFKGKHIDISF
ncbi:hypothetical protein FHS18_001471 [Paenibacillus phyllosphaerae]|uniref:Uncharacterized protein n=1 Tax=Paenibacillus phyllosphaerae TaxID=274593 RepID=A0A7W5AVU2_9BACL|nr:hypothetical protein [Paenibacillus phyllosphaerae]MBB3109419.1 hypothetical protein [Paenibacillus phyllosphaerae]